MESWIVHKFGGSSVADASCFERVAAIVAGDAVHPQGVVLSACRGVTDALLGLVALAEAQDPAVKERLAAVRTRHVDIADALLPADIRAQYIETLDTDCRDIAGILDTVARVRSAAENIRDLVAGFGEIWSTRLFAAYLPQRTSRPVRWLDARKVLTVEWGPLGPLVQWGPSRASMAREVEADFDGVLIITGFIATDARGIQTTLGRNGSDYSGSIFGALLSAKEIHIWTDVDGVLSADPRRVPDAKVIDALSYSEAMELAYFGAKVIHPQTMAPAVKYGIPIWIRNTFAPEKAGSLICAAPVSSHPVKGITSIESLALLNLEGAGMIGVPGTAQRLFGALRDAGISVILISQGSSEHSICFAIPDAQADKAREVVEQAFDRELREAQIQRVEVSRGASIVAVVGDGMAGSRGVAAKVFSALGNAGVNIRAIAQGSSERNISVVVDGASATRALRAVHAAFYLSPHTISLGLLGPGVVGRALLAQLEAQIPRLRAEVSLDLRVRAIATSKTMLLADQEIDLSRWKEELDARGVPLDMEAFTAHVRQGHLPHAAILDCTASADVAARYADWLRDGVHVITPNKKANSGAWAGYEAIRAARRKVGSHYLYEATVGAGLPIIQTLRDLRETGDQIASIEGIFSGTLAYLFNVFDGKESFSAIVAAAKQRGYTEPDPRDDLSGTDVARKIVILGREMGLSLRLEDVTVEGLVPTALTSVSVDEFMQRLPEFDSEMKRRFDEAAAAGEVLRYVGRLDAAGKATVGLVRLPQKHPFGNIALTDNVVRFSTRRYAENPLIVQGPGAGPEVTAGGIFGDLLRLSAYLGAKL